MSSTRLVSIGLPVRNGEKFLRESLESILSQTYRNIEIILSDNASTDSTREICEEYARRDSRILYRRLSENIGAVRNYNAVFELSSGDYFMWHAHDDLVDRRFIERAVGILEDEPGTVLCFSSIRYIDERGTTISEAGEDFSILGGSVAGRVRAFVRHQRRSADVFWAIFGLIRREALLTSGLFKPFVASDQALLLRLIMIGGLHRIPEPLFFRRIHAGASTVLLPRQTYRDRARWYSSRSDNAIVVPNWQICLEDFSCVLRDAIPIHQKARCLLSITGMFLFRWRRLAHELVSIPRQLRENFRSRIDPMREVRPAAGPLKLGRLSSTPIQAEITGSGSMLEAEDR